MSHRPSFTQKNRQAQRSITTPPSQPVIGAVGHQADPVILRQTLNNPRHARPEAILALQHTIGNQAIQRLLTPHDSGGSRTPNIQRQIRVKKGPTYDSAEALPPRLRDSEDLRTKADHPDTYLVKTAKDLKRRARGEDALMLSPHRHLIGEDHDDSYFRDIVKEWGWGADRMAEGLQTSQSVECSISKSNIKPKAFSGQTYRGAKHLENMHAYTLGNLSVLQAELNGLEKKVPFLKMRVRRGWLNDKDKHDFEEKQGLVVKRAKQVYGRMKDYRKAAEKSLDIDNPQSETDIRLHEFGVEMADQWDQLFTDLKEIQIQSDLWSHSEEVGNKLQQAAEDAKMLKEKLHLIAALVVPMMQAEAPNPEDMDIPDQAWIDADNNPFGITDPIREAFMIENINNKLNKPGIVQIGAEHVRHLRGQIADGKYYEDANDFYADLLT